MSTLRRLGPDRPLNRCLRPDDPQSGADFVSGITGSTPCAHIELPLDMVENDDMTTRYPQTEAALRKSLADEAAGIWSFSPDDASRIAGMVNLLRSGGSLPAVVGESAALGRVRVWDGYHRISACRIAGRSSIAAYVSPLPAQ